MKTKTILLSAGGGLLLILVMMSLIPVSNPTLDDSEIATGNVELIVEEGGPFDIHIQLINDDHIYYVNRGVEKGLHPGELNEKLAGSDITIHYANHWTPLDPFGKLKPITRITHEEAIIYDQTIE